MLKKSAVLIEVAEERKVLKLREWVVVREVAEQRQIL